MLTNPSNSENCETSRRHIRTTSFEKPDQILWVKGGLVIKLFIITIVKFINGKISLTGPLELSISRRVSKTPYLYDFNN